jgi:hypothetical protein
VNKRQNQELETRKSTKTLNNYFSFSFSFFNSQKLTQLICNLQYQLKILTHRHSQLTVHSTVSNSTRSRRNATTHHTGKQPSKNQAQANSYQILNYLSVIKIHLAQNLNVGVSVLRVSAQFNLFCASLFYLSWKSIIYLCLYNSILHY